MSDEPQTEHEALIRRCDDVYRNVEGNSTACAVTFAVEILGPILLDIRDALAHIADRVTPR